MALSERAFGLPLPGIHASGCTLISTNPFAARATYNAVRFGDWRSPLEMLSTLPWDGGPGTYELDALEAQLAALGFGAGGLARG